MRTIAEERKRWPHRQCGTESEECHPEQRLLPAPFSPDAFPNSECRQKELGGPGRKGPGRRPIGSVDPRHPDPLRPRSPEKMQAGGPTVPRPAARRNRQRTAGLPLSPDHRPSGERGRQASHGNPPQVAQLEESPVEKNGQRGNDQHAEHEAVVATQEIGRRRGQPKTRPVSNEGRWANRSRNIRVSTIPHRGTSCTIPNCQCTTGIHCTIRPAAIETEATAPRPEHQARAPTVEREVDE